MADTSPHNVAEWWALLDARLDDLKQTMRLVGMSAAAHQRLDVAIGARHQANAWRVLQETWENAPDAAVIHTWPGWHALCDLCSEGMWMIKEGKS